MKQNLSLDDVSLFLAVVDAGGLAGAARATDVSVPTLSRRMTALESALRLRLFQRGKRGYSLTPDGRSFLARAEPLRSAAVNLAAPLEGPSPVRITAGLWTSRFLARNIRSLWQPSAPWVPEFLASNAVVDVARRAADIGIRNRRPDQSWLAGRRTATITYAPYGTLEAGGFIALPQDQNGSPSSNWVWSQQADQIVTTASDPRLAVDLARSGLGSVVLPTFAGNDMPGLSRTGPVIEDLTHEEWIVCHHDGRFDPRVRSALDTLTAVLTDEGLRPRP
jgi:DNA-binding transcriptional LysR family regulator